MKPTIRIQSLLLATTLLFGQFCYAQVPQQLNYQGRVTVSGINYSGPGQFKFALVGPEQNTSTQATAVPVIGGLGDGMGPRVLSIIVNAAGSGYIEPPVVTIDHPTATGASAHAVLDGSGAVLEIIVDTDGVGQGYDGQTTITLSAPPENLQRPTRWSNDNTSLMGSEPTDSVEIPVSGGLYSVALGNTTLPNMAMLPENLFANYGELYLRVWFNASDNGFQLLSPDQRLLTAPYSMFAATIPDGSVTSQKIASGAVGSDQIASGAIDADKLAPGSVTTDRINIAGSPTVGNVLSYGPGGALTWSAGASNGSGWALSGNAGVGSGSFLGTLDNTPLAFRINNEEVLRLDTDTDLIFPSLPETSGNSGANGLGTYVFNSGLFGTTFGRTFGGADIDGPMLYGQKGGGLGIKKQFAGDFGFTEKAILNWRENIINVYSDSGFSISAADTPMITRAFNPFTVSTGSKYHGHGRWGMFMEPGSLNIGIPSIDAGVRSFTVSRYDANGARWNLCQIDNNSGKFSVNGLGQELAYLGGDGNGDVEFGSLNANVSEAVFFNPNRNGGERLNIHARDAFVRQLTIYGGADLAEPFAMSHEGVEPGSVVVIDETNPGKLRMSHAAYDKKVAGIVSGADGIRPGISMIQEDMLEAGENVALSGRVYVKANNSAGDISPGDLLTTSAIPGEAMKASDHNRAQGAILGKAMTGLSSSYGKVLVLVTLQ
jgi:hypothetical protein